MEYFWKLWFRPRDSELEVCLFEKSALGLEIRTWFFNYGGVFRKMGQWNSNFIYANAINSKKDL